jgi:GMP synthase-like glutamine amidotransferase
LIERAISRDAPILGHGFGAELIAVALESRIVENAVQQIGWFTVQPLNNEASRQWLEGMPQWLEIFKWHGQAFDLPHGAQSLLKSDWTSIEAFAMDNILAFQGHLEIDRAVLETWLREYAHDVANPQPDPRSDPKLVVNWDAIVQGPEVICFRLEERLNKLHQAADLVYERWLQRVSK